MQEFVEDLLSNGRIPREILIIANNTRWNADIEEIREIIKSFSKKLKKKFQIIDGNDDNRVKSKKLKILERIKDDKIDNQEEDSDKTI